MFFKAVKFRVELCGTHILLPVEDDGEPIVGFRAVRVVRARSAAEAGTRAISLLRGEWLRSPFNGVNRSGEPAIRVEGVEKVRNPFARARGAGGFTFFRHGDRDFESASPAPGQSPSPAETLPTGAR